MPSATARPSASSPRSRLSATERREQLLDATRELAAERGFHAITIDAVARAAGITRPVVYGHFGDLPGLLNALVDRESERATQQLAELLPTQPDPDPVGQLLGALGAFLEAVRDEPVRWKLILLPPEGAPEVMRERFVAERAGVTDRLAQVIGPGLAQAVGTPPPDPELLALTLQAIAEELARLLLTDPRRYPVERLIGHARWALEALGSSAPR